MRALTVLTAICLTASLACASGGGAPQPASRPPVAKAPPHSGDPDDPTADAPDDDVDTSTTSQRHGPSV